MHETFLKPGWETFLFAVIFIGLLLMWIFRLDHLLFPSKRGPRPQRPVGVVDRDGEPLMTDPDGRPWRKKGRRK
jgi:hypothetical protein